MEDRMYLNSVDFDITDLCNLNCAGCNHFASLVKDPFYYKLEEFERDIKRLSELFIIQEIRISGGEPTIHPQLNAILELTLQYFPITKIILITNGKLKDKVLYVKEHYPTIRISQSHYSDVERIFDNDISDKKFKIIGLNIDGSTPLEKSIITCPSKHCFSLWNGKLYLCPIVRHIEKFEKYFNVTLSGMEKYGGIDIYNNSAKDILIYLNSKSGALQSCKWCNSSGKLLNHYISAKDINEWMD